MKELAPSTVRCAIAGIVAFAAAICCADGLNVRKSTCGRTWQVSYAPSEPIVWIWPESATEAILTVTSHVGRASVQTYTFTRENAADTGEWTLPASSGERLYDLALDIKSGGKVLESLCARVVVLPESFDVLATNTAAWSIVSDRSPRPVPYDAAWTTNKTVDSAGLSLAMVGGTPVAVPLAGVSGFEPLDMAARFGARTDGPFGAALAFDGGDPLYVAELRRTFPGIVLSIR